jgi:hypothetical protein
MAQPLKVQVDTKATIRTFMRLSVIGNPLYKFHKELRQGIGKRHTRFLDLRLITLNTAIVSPDQKSEYRSDLY